MGGGSGGGQVGALTPGFLGGGFFTLVWERGVGMGCILVFWAAGVVLGAMGGLHLGVTGGPGALGLVKWTVTCSLPLVWLKVLLAAENKMKWNDGKQLTKTNKLTGCY